MTWVWVILVVEEGIDFLGASLGSVVDYDTGISVKNETFGTGVLGMVQA